MSTYPMIEAAALVITGEVARAIGKKCHQTFNDLEDAYDFLEKKNATVCYCSEFTGDIVSHDFGVEDPIDVSASGCFMAYIPCSKQPDLFHAAYESFDELVDEFRKALVDFLPEDFDLRKYVCRIDGTCYC